MVFIMNPLVMDDSALWPGNSYMNLVNPWGFQRPDYSYEPTWFQESPYYQPYRQPAGYQMFDWTDTPQYAQHQCDDEEDYDNDHDVDSDDDGYNKKQNIISQRGNSMPQKSSSRRNVHGSQFPQISRQGQDPGCLRTQRIDNRSNFPFHNGDPSIMLNQRNPGRQINQSAHATKKNSENSSHGYGFDGKRNNRMRQQLPVDTDHRCSHSRQHYGHTPSKQIEQRTSGDIKQLGVTTVEDKDVERPVGVVHHIPSDNSSNNCTDASIERDSTMEALQNDEADGIDLKNSSIHADEVNQDASKQSTVKKHPSSADRLKAANDELEGLQKRIESFTGVRLDKEYLVIDEMLTRILLSLDEVESNGDDEIRQRRRELVRCAQSLVSRLEDKTKVENP